MCFGVSVAIASRSAVMLTNNDNRLSASLAVWQIELKRHDDTQTRTNSV